MSELYTWTIRLPEDENGPELTMIAYAYKGRSMAVGMGISDEALARAVERLVVDEDLRQEIERRRLWQIAELRKRVVGVDKDDGGGPISEE